MDQRELAERLGAWDGKATVYLETLYRECVAVPATVAQLLPLVARPELQVGATWLLKRYADYDCAPITRQTDIIVTHLSQLCHWEAQLHILQLLRCMALAASHRLAVERFVRDAIVSPKSFVRAWAYNALAILADRFPQYCAERDWRYRHALTHEAAAVRARIRNALSGRW